MNKGILLSGGVDSIALAYWRRPTFAFTINYGQKPFIAESRSSAAICSLLKIKHYIIEVDCSPLGSGDLLKNEPLPMAPSTEWWPFRNQLLITLASMKAISLNINEIMAGSVMSDGFHKDGTSTFYELIDSLTGFQEGGIRVTAPAIGMSSVELIVQSKIPPEILLYAHSCHTGNVPCGNCRGCFKYIDVMQKLKNAKWQESATFSTESSG